MRKYPVVLEKDDNGTFLVTFPDVPQAHTFGDDESEALTRAVDALETALSMYIEDRRDIPRPSPIKRRIKSVVLPALSEAKIALYEAMRGSRITKAELARRLNCHLPRIERLLDLGHASRLDQLEAALQAIAKRLNLSIEDAA